MSFEPTGAETMFASFVESGRLAALRLVAELGESEPAPEVLTRMAGEVFELRCDAALIGLDAVAIGLKHTESVLLQITTAESRWAEVRGPLKRLLSVLGSNLTQLSKPDVSGAQFGDLEPLRMAIAALEPLVTADADLPETAEISDLPVQADPVPATDDCWRPQVDADMVEPFLEEVTERVDGLAQKLLRLEQSPGDTELVREIFRDLHTIKGSSGFVGLVRMNRLAHAAEDLVGQLREGGRVADRPTVDALLAALDGLRAILAAALVAAATQPLPSAGVPILVPIDALVSRLRAPHLQTQPVAAVERSDGNRPATLAPQVERQTLRVDFEKLDSLLNLVGELVLGKARLRAGVQNLGGVVREFESALQRRQPLDSDDLDRFARLWSARATDLDGAAGALDQVSTELRQQVMKLRMLPVGRVLQKHHRTVRELAHQLGKLARLEIIGAETDLDKVLLEQIEDPLLHLVRNSLDHGIELPAARAAAGKPEEGVVRLAARHRGNQIELEIGDDGAGIDPARLRAKALEKALVTEGELAAMSDTEVLDLIFRPGFSTASRVTDLSGRGVGMDVVRDAIQRLSGSIELKSEKGIGTRFLLKLPLTLAIIQVLLVRVAGEQLALPLDVVERTVHLDPDEIHLLHAREVFYLDDEKPVPLIDVARTLEIGHGVRGETIHVVLVRAAGEFYGLVVERLLDKREIVVKSLGELLAVLPCAAGATLVGERVVLVLDPAQLIQRSFSMSVTRSTIVTAPVGRTKTATRRRVLLAEDSDVVREALRRQLEAQGCQVVTARDGAEALAIADADPDGFDLISTDVVMPGLDGYDLTRALRAQARHRKVPVIMITSRGDALDRVRGFDAGVDEYLIKPVEVGELERALDRHLGGRA